MEKIDYQLQEKQLLAFEAAIFEVDRYGSAIKNDYRIDFKGPWYARVPVFGFKTGAGIPRGVREICYQLFYRHFPGCDISSL